MFLYGFIMDFVVFLYGFKNLLLIFFVFLYDYIKDLELMNGYIMDFFSFSVYVWSFYGFFVVVGWI